MPSYEFLCRTCGATFVESRPMRDSTAPATCPEGHDDTARLFGLAGVMRSGSAQPAAPVGGCCGGGCGCG